MKPPLGLRVALVAALISSAGCSAWFAREVEETRTGLLGRTGLELRACLGIPTDFAVDGDVETQTYHFAIDDELGDAFEAGGMTAGMGGVHFPGEHGYEPRGFPLDDGPPPFCQLDFELTKGRVTHVASQGRTREGMNADSSCLLRAHDCVPQSDEPDGDE